MQIFAKDLLLVLQKGLLLMRHPVALASFTLLSHGHLIEAYLLLGNLNKNEIFTSEWTFFFQPPL